MADFERRRMEPIPQISKALEIIENVQKSWEDVWVNKIQCKRVADRFKAIGELLKIYRTPGAGSICDDNTLSYPAFDEILTVLQKGQALVSSYVNRTGITSVLTWSDNREAFKEIHEELETMKATFPFNAFGDQFETASWSQRDAMLTQDAEKDDVVSLQSGLGKLVNFVGSGGACTDRSELGSPSGVPLTDSRIFRMEPIPQIAKALEIIKNVQKSWEDVWVNKNQCKRVADRFKAIGGLLEIYRTTGADSNCDDNTLDYPAFDELLTVLQKGQALVSTYVNRTGITSVLTWSDNREAFKEIHEELETMFPFDGYGDQSETTSGAQRDAMFTQDAEQDLEAMPQSLRMMMLDDEEEVIRVALEKSVEPTDSRLPGYLQIDITKIIIKAPVRDLEILSKPGKDDFWAMGSWLGCDFAVKVFKSKQVEWNKDQMTKEAGKLMKLRHPHIVPIVGFAQGPESCALLMELMPERDLRHYMKKQMKIQMENTTPRPFTRSQELDIITQIARGMLYLHTQGYVHGDLKCSNILVKKYGDYVEVKIGGLRFAEKLQNSGGRSEVQRPRWAPLEALENYGGVKPTDDLRKQADVHSFAMTCYEIITGKLPFQDIRGDELIKMIKGGQRPELPEDLGLKELKGLIGSCWDSDPNARPAFEQICVSLKTIRTSMPVVSNMTFGKQTWNPNIGVEESEGDVHVDTNIPGYLRIKPGELRKVRRVGEGAFARVYKATWLGRTVAVKRMNMIPWKELNFLIQLRHPYIIQLYGSSIDTEGHCSIVMEYMEGSLRDLINFRMPTERPTSFSTVRPFGPAEELSIIKRLAQGMVFLHSRGVVHRDLKAKNVMCQEHAGYFDVKIADFGISEFVADPGEGRSAPLGTGFWRAPELFDRGAQRGIIDLMAADVYSFAMTCYEIVTGNEPFQHGGSIETIKAGARPELPRFLEQSGLKGLIEACWAKDPNDRPAFEQICVSLETIRSLLPAVTNKSSGNVVINVVGSMSNRLFSTTTWNGMSGQTESEGSPKLNIPECPIIKHEALKKVKRVGRGSCAKVYEVIWLGCTVAVKRFETITLPRQELNLWIQLRHPCIVQLVGLSEDQRGRALIVMEFMRGSLRDLIDSRIKESSTKWKPINSGKVKLPFKLEEEVRIITQLAQGMEFLHFRGVAHLDLKANNVMYQDHSGYFDVKIVDFGVSQVIAEAEGVVGVGTGYWRAPEMFLTPANMSLQRSREFVNLMAADVYSFAMTCYEIVTGLRPFKLEFDNRMMEYDEVQGENGRRPELPSDLNAGLKDLIQDCWHPNPEERPDFAQICTRLNAL